MTTRLKHTDDDGDISIFVSGDEVLFACNHGHAWTAQVSVRLHAHHLDHDDGHDHDHVRGRDAGPTAAPVERNCFGMEPESTQPGPTPPTHGAA